MLLLLLVVPNLLPASTAKVVSSPALLPNVSPFMLEANYWIQQIPQPDQISYSPEELRGLEAKWQAKGLLTDLNHFPSILSNRKLRAWLTEDFPYIRKSARYDENGKRLRKSDLRVLEQNVNLPARSLSTQVGWGMTVQPTRMKLLPTLQIATYKPLDLEFNQFSHSEIRLAEPLAILQESSDHAWLYVQTETGRGWVRTQDVARADRETILRYRQRPLRVVTAAAVRLCLENNGLLQLSAKMGTRLAWDPPSGSLVCPRQDAYGNLCFVAALAEPAAGMSDHPRPFTSRAIIEQAFRLLDEPYGWGGAEGFGDCSEFIQAIGLSCGLTLPRSTAGLRRALPSAKLNGSTEAKGQLLNTLPVGLSLLTLPGHVMLLLGADQGRYYVIHNFYGLHQHGQQGEYVVRIARVVVSELSLGEESLRGSLFQRVNRALLLAPEHLNAGCSRPVRRLPPGG
jgi:cell wall-associated NlpC family hydrolase